MLNYTKNQPINCIFGENEMKKRLFYELRNHEYMDFIK